MSVVQLGAHPAIGGERVPEMPFLAFERDAGELGQLLAGDLSLEPPRRELDIGPGGNREGGIAGGDEILPLAAGDPGLQLAHALVDPVRRLRLESTAFGRDRSA